MAQIDRICLERRTIIIEGDEFRGKKFQYNFGKRGDQKWNYLSKIHES